MMYSDSPCFFLFFIPPRQICYYSYRQTSPSFLLNRFIHRQITFLGYPLDSQLNTRQENTVFYESSPSLTMSWPLACLLQKLFQSTIKPAVICLLIQLGLQNCSLAQIYLIMLSISSIYCLDCRMLTEGFQCLAGTNRLKEASFIFLFFLFNSTLINQNIEQLRNFKRNTPLNLSVNLIT